jgi:hypothetical protein
MLREIMNHAVAYLLAHLGFLFLVAILTMLLSMFSSPTGSDGLKLPPVRQECPASLPIPARLVPSRAEFKIFDEVACPFRIKGLASS